MATLKTRLAIQRLHPLFVAEVTGIDLTVPIDREDFRAIWEAFNEHQILVFRDQAFDDESQMAFSRNFGALETMEAHASNNWNPGHIAVMTNLDANGGLLPLDHPSMVHRLRNELWHTDSSFKPVAALCSLLSGREVPPVGGNTDFASARAAYAALPEAPAPGSTAAAVQMRRIDRHGIRLGVLDNGKGNADHLLRFMVERAKAAVPVESVVVLRKAAVNLPASTDILDQLAREADVVVSAMAD